MLKFNTILREYGFDPQKVFLLRHEDQRVPMPMYQVWKTRRSDFEKYQSSQPWKYRFDQGSVLASFVVGPGGETLLVGMYDVLECTEFNGPYDDPLTGSHPTQKWAIHETKPSRWMAELEERLVIDWGRGQSWRQKAGNQNKNIIEIRRQPQSPIFPGYARFIHRVEELGGIHESWRQGLENRKGVYLLTFDDGFQYVGSATGEKGFWQRWEDYRKSGHGGNVVLKRDRKDARKAMVSILEVSGSAQTDQEIISQEMVWKVKLGSRAKALDD